jgi:hypothetical protein
VTHYTFVLHAWPRHVSLTVGWDPGRETFFARMTVYLYRRRELAESVPLPPRRIGDLDTLEGELNRQLKGRLPSVTIPSRMRKQLLLDKGRSPAASG